jgi:hypothetical protein
MTDHAKFANPALAELRADFRQSGGRFLSMPIAGAICWSTAAISGVFLPPSRAAIALVVALVAITPLSLVIARYVGERLVGGANDLGRLMGRSMLMVNLFWAVAVSFWVVEPTSLPLTAGVIMGLQWIVLGWIIQHWIGFFHAIVRTFLIVAVWWLFPESRFAAVPAAVVAVYLVSIVVLAKRKLPEAATFPG